MDAPVRFSSHRVFSFVAFKLPFGSLEGRFLGDLCTPCCAEDECADDYDRAFTRPVAPWVPEALCPAVTGKFNSEPTLKASEAAYGTGLHLPVASLLSGKQPERCQTWHTRAFSGTSPGSTILGLHPRLTISSMSVRDL